MSVHAEAHPVSRFDECDRELEPARVADRETKIGGAAESHGTNYWFFCCEMPDLMVPYRMAMARELLEKRQADVVSQMVSV